MADGDNQDPNANGNNTNAVDPTIQQQPKSPLDMMTQQDIDKQKIQDELNAAVKRGDRVRVEELVDRGADVNAPGANGLTAMGNAVENNDSGMSREFLQQKANGNIAFDPNADQNLIVGTAAPPPAASTPVDPVTGAPVDPVTGAPANPTTDPTTGTPVDPTTGQANPNAPGTDVTTSANVADAVAQGLTAEEAAAAGNFALAAQLEAQDDLKQEALEQNDVASTDLSDGDMSYASSVADSMGGYYDDPFEDYYDDDFGNDPYDPYDDEGYYGDDYGDDDYGYNADDYGYGDDYGYDDPASPSSFSFNDPTLTGPTGANGLNFSDPALASLTGPSGANGLNFSNPSSPSSSFFNFSSPSLTDPLASPTNTASIGGPSSNFFDFSSPTTGAGQSVWNTSFFDPAAINAASGVASTLASAGPAIAPTNPYYKPSSGAASSSMSM